MDKVTVFGLKGEKAGEASVPKVFSTKYNPELIKRASLSIQSAKKQPQGMKPDTGMDTSAEYRGLRSLPTGERTINVGHARLPRMKNRSSLLSGRVAKVTQAVGSRKAHPPKVEKKVKEKINKKEKKAALYSAIATSANKELVADRHVLADGVELPLVVVDGFEGLKKTKEVIGALKGLKVLEDVEYAKNGRRLRAGKGKKRGRKYKQKKSLLIVTAKDGGIYKAARNLSGVDVCSLKKLNVDLLAPGTKAGRLVVWSESALKELGKW